LIYHIVTTLQLRRRTNGYRARAYYSVRYGVARVPNGGSERGLRRNAIQTRGLHALILQTLLQQIANYRQRRVSVDIGQSAGVGDWAIGEIVQRVRVFADRFHGFRGFRQIRSGTFRDGRQSVNRRRDRFELVVNVGDG